jgi:hypothetical protein
VLEVLQVREVREVREVLDADVRAGGGTGGIG